MSDGNDAVNIWEIVQHARFFGCFSNELCDRAGTIHRRQNPEVIARADAAVCTVIAIEGALVGGCFKFLGLTCMGVILRVRPHTEVLNMHMFTNSDVRCRLPN